MAAVLLPLLGLVVRVVLPGLMIGSVVGVHRAFQAAKCGDRISDAVGYGHDHVQLVEDIVRHRGKPVLDGTPRAVPALPEVLVCGIGRCQTARKGSQRCHHDAAGIGCLPRVSVVQMPVLLFIVSQKQPC